MEKIQAATNNGGYIYISTNYGEYGAPLEVLKIGPRLLCLQMEKS